MIPRHRRASVGPTAFHVREILSAAPCALPSDSDERTRLLERKLRAGDPVTMAEVVRDLAWRQRRGRANGQDLRLLWHADKELGRWLAAQTGEEPGWSKRKMRETIERAISLFI